MGTNVTVAEDFKWLAEASIGSNDFEDAGAGGRGDIADQLSIAGNVFSFKTAEGTTEADTPRQLYFVYLGGKKPKSRSLYAGAFNDDDPQAPVCTSQDGVTPEEGSQVPVITDPTHPHVGCVAASCRECPMAKWGSAISVKTGKAVPACKEHKDIAVKVMGVEGSWLLKLPPASWTNWDNATKKVKTAIDADAAAHEGKTMLSLGTCVMSVSFGPGMGNLIFEPKAWLDQPKLAGELAAVAALRRDADGVDRLLWGSTGRRLQYEDGKAPKVIKPAVVTPVVEQPQPTQQKLAAAQQQLRAAAQAASAALQTEPAVPEPAIVPEVKVKKTKATANVADIMASMGIGV